MNRGPEFKNLPDSIRDAEQLLRPPMFCCASFKQPDSHPRLVAPILESIS
jgi:hypothetical protein